MRFSIRYQLLLPLLALLLGLIGASIWNAWSSGQRASRQIETQIDNIAATVSAVSFPLNTQTLHLMKGLSGAEFLVGDAEHRPLRDSEGHLLSTLEDVPDVLPAPGGHPTEHFNKPVRIADTNYLCGGLPLRPGARPGAILYIFYPESLWLEAFWQTLRPALVLGVVGGAVAVLVSVLLTRRLSRRIGEMERRTRLIAGGDFSPMPLPRRNDELRDLGRSVNEMAHQLAQFQGTVRQNERLRLLGQVSGGLAHQLRNGVTGARLAVQLHSQDCPGTQEAEPLAVALRQLALVEMHLKKFLDVGKVNNLQRQPCDLQKIMRETLELLGPQCRHAHIDVRAFAPATPAFDMIGDAAQLSHLFLNVLTNAVEAAGPGGWVEVRWGAASDNRAFVEISDSGPGPAPALASRLYEPFATGKQEGVGLGLAVARQVAEAHGGNIAWSATPRGTCFRIELSRTISST